MVETAITEKFAVLPQNGEGCNQNTQHSKEDSTVNPTTPRPTNRTTATSEKSRVFVALRQTAMSIAFATALLPRPASADLNCLIEEQVLELLQEQTSGLGTTFFDSARRILISLESDDVDISETEAKLTWNLDPQLTFSAELPTEPALYTPLKEQLQGDEAMLKEFEDQAKESGGVTFRLRYNLMKSGKQKRLPSGVASTRALAAGLIDARNLDDLDEKVAALLGQSFEIPKQEDETAEEEKKRKAKVCQNLKSEVNRLVAKNRPRQEGEEQTDEGQKKKEEDDKKEEEEAFSQVITALATAVSNAPQFTAEVYRTENSSLVGPDSWGASIRYVIGLHSGRKYLDTPESTARFLNTAVNHPQRIIQRRRFALIANYEELDDYDFSARLAEPVVEPGGSTWSASAAYSLEFRTGALQSEVEKIQKKESSAGDTPVQQPARFEVLASYEDLPASDMRPDDRFLVKTTLTVPTQIAGDLVFGLAWANEPEFLTDLDFDEQVSAQVGLVYKLGAAKGKSVFGQLRNRER